MHHAILFCVIARFDCVHMQSVKLLVLIVEVLAM